MKKNLNRSITKKYKSLTGHGTAQPISIKKSFRSLLIDQHNKKYLDLSGGYGVVSLGWNSLSLFFRSLSQLLKLPFSSPWTATTESVSLAEELLRLIGKKNYKIIRALSGTEANETAIKLATLEKKGIVSYDNSYHGGSQSTMNLGDYKKFHFHLPYPNPSFHKVEYPNCLRCPFGKQLNTCNTECIKPLQKLIAKDSSIGSIFIEPVQGSGGIIIPPPKYIKELNELREKYSLLIICDEVITGLGRTGSFFAFKKLGIHADIITLAKGLGGGYTSIGATIAPLELINKLETNYHDVTSSTSWNPLSTAIAKQVITDILKKDICTSSNRLGKYFKDKLTQVFAKYQPMCLAEIRQIGLMIGIELVKDTKSLFPNSGLGKKILIGLSNRGVLVATSWNWETIVLLPPLTITKKDIDKALSVFELLLISLKRQSSK